MKQELKNAQNEIFVGVIELAAAAAKILVASNTVQERETVTSLPDERTVRYYITEGLISSAEEKQGTSSVFGYLQLLQLLAIKKLQVEHLSIRQIRQIVLGKNAAELENLLEDEKEAESKNDAQKFLESLLSKPQPPQSAMPPSLPMNKTQSVARFASKQSSEWKRFELAPDLELHIGENFDTPDSAGETGKLLQKFQQIVESFRKGKK